MEGKIQISGMEFYAHHGCFEEERLVGTNFKVDVTIYCDILEAAQQDDLQQTVNYQQVYALVKEVMQEPVKLLETLAYKIICSLKLNFSSIAKLSVTVYKMNPPIGGPTQWTAVTIES